MATTESDLMKAGYPPPPPQEDVVKKMVDRFLNWKLPDNFNPDNGISFEPIGNKGHPTAEYIRHPSGTNLFDAIQAEAMVRFILNI